MIGSQWEKAFKNLQEFMAVRDAIATEGKNKCSVTLQMTFMESNIHELADIIRLAIDLGIDRVKGHHLWVHSAQMTNQSMRRNKESIQRWNEYVQEAQTAAESKKLPNGENIRLENIFQLKSDSIEDIAPGGPCPFLGKEAWINPEGRFDPCCAPDKLRRSLGDFGNLHTHDFTEIWNGETYSNLLKSYKKQALCKKCNMRKAATKEVL